MRTGKERYYHVGPLPSSMDETRARWAKVKFPVENVRWLPLPHRMAATMRTDAFSDQHLPVYYVYMIYDADGNPVWVGCGKARRVIDSIRDHGATAEILSMKMTKPEARAVEECLIRILGRRDRDTFGLLKNKGLNPVPCDPR